MSRQRRRRELKKNERGMKGKHESREGKGGMKSHVIRILLQGKHESRQGKGQGQGGMKAASYGPERQLQKQRKYPGAKPTDRERDRDREACKQHRIRTMRR